MNRSTRRWLFLATLAATLLVAGLAIWVHPYFWLALIPALFLRPPCENLVGCRTWTNANC